ncbi:MAG TPA: flagellar hook-length control protein FliK, partial [Desulfomicrobiaceae bacterium]|nr:flagellar hook-length control protein FliK [Desulfomicrobiaceae bacterium]
MPQAASAPVAGSVMEQHLSGLLAGGPSPTNGPESIVTSSGTRVPVMDLVNQVAAQASVPGNSGPQRIVLQLNPQDLGPVTLHVSVRKERVHARIEAGSE